MLFGFSPINVGWKRPAYVSRNGTLVGTESYNVSKAFERLGSTFVASLVGGALAKKIVVVGKTTNPLIFFGLFAQSVKFIS